MINFIYVNVVNVVKLILEIVLMFENWRNSYIYVVSFKFNNCMYMYL